MSTNAFTNLTPNWYACVMGTGIISVAAASLPIHLSGLPTLGLAAWAAASMLLIIITAATARHWILDPQAARSYAANPVMVHFYGAPAMALMTVGAATLLWGKDVIGIQAAVTLDWALWLGGTAGGLVCTAVIPYLMFTRRPIHPHGAFGGWLMPVVPPMVSASTGALLIPHTSAGQWRLTLLLSCYMMFGLSLLASFIVITLICHRLVDHGVPQARMVPTLWIVLGPLGQSITAVNLLGAVAHECLPAPYSTALATFGVAYGVPVFGLAVLWASAAGAMTIRTACHGLPFSLTWWSFTFPIGTCVTGSSALARHTGADLFGWAAVSLYGILIGMWFVVVIRTMRLNVVRPDPGRPTAVPPAAALKTLTGPVGSVARLSAHPRLIDSPILLTGGQRSAG